MIMMFWILIMFFTMSIGPLIQLTYQITLADLFALLFSSIVAIFTAFTYRTQRQMSRLENPEPTVLSIQQIKFIIEDLARKQKITRAMIEGLSILNDSKHHLLVISFHYVITNGITLIYGSSSLNTLVGIGNISVEFPIQGEGGKTPLILKTQTRNKVLISARVFIKGPTIKRYYDSLINDIEGLVLYRSQYKALS
jgi:hypothetical protein